MNLKFGHHLGNRSGIDPDNSKKKQQQPRESKFRFLFGEAYRIGSNNNGSGLQAKYGGALDIYS